MRDGTREICGRLISRLTTCLSRGKGVHQEEQWSAIRVRITSCSMSLPPHPPLSPSTGPPVSATVAVHRAARVCRCRRPPARRLVHHGHLHRPRLPSPSPTSTAAILNRHDHHHRPLLCSSVVLVIVLGARCLWPQDHRPHPRLRACRPRPPWPRPSPTATVPSLTSTSVRTSSSAVATAATCVRHGHSPCPSRPPLSRSSAANHPLHSLHPSPTTPLVHSWPSPSPSPSSTAAAVLVHPGHGPRPRPPR